MFATGAAQLWDLMYGPIAVEESNFVCDVWQRHASADKAYALDIGCGTGRYVIPLSRKGWTVTGIDSSPAMLEVLQKKAGRYDVAPLLHNLDFSKFESESRYDVVLAFFSIIYLLTDEEINCFLTKVRSMTQENGLFLVNFFNAYEFWNTEGWNHTMARIFRGGHLKVEYTSTPSDRLHGIAATEDFRSFSRDDGTNAFDLSQRSIRFHSPQAIKLFLQKAGFGDICFFSGFSKKPITTDRAPIITAVAKPARRQ